MQFRELRFEGKADSKTRSVPITISSDTPVDRGDYVEILDHSPGSVDLSRAPLPLIESHDAGRLNIGIVDDLRLEGGRLRGTATFGHSARAAEVFADVRAGIVRGVSIGYDLLDNGRPVPHSSGRGRLFKFRPVEASAVAVPADTSVGFYRSKRTPQMETQFETGTAGEHQHQSRSERRAAAYQAGGDSAAVERERCTGIMALATSHNLREMGDRAVADGTPLELFRGMALDALHRRGSDRPLYQPAAQIGLSERETRDFSLTRLYRSIFEGRPDVAPFERECVNAVETKLQRSGMPAHRGGLRLPYEVMRSPIPGLEVRGGQLMVGDRVVMQRDLGKTVGASGASLVGTDLLAGSFIDFLRARTLVYAMGAIRLSGLVGNVSIPKQLGKTSNGWVAEAGAATESDMTFGALTMSPKTAHGIQDVTRDMLIQSTPAIEGIIRADLLAVMAETVDYAAINGSGTSNQPTGLWATAGIGAVIGGTNGGAPTWDHMVKLEEALAQNNHMQGALGYLTNPAVRSKLKRTQKFSGTNGMEIFERPFTNDDAGAFGVVNGYRCGVTTQVRSDYTKGTAVGICSGVFFGNWADLMIGEWATAEILPDPYTQATNRIIRMHVWQSVDVGVRRTGSFSAMFDVLTA